MDELIFAQPEDDLGMPEPEGDGREHDRPRRTVGDLAVAQDQAAEEDFLGDGHEQDPDVRTVGGTLADGTLADGAGVAGAGGQGYGKGPGRFRPRPRRNVRARPSAIRTARPRRRAPADRAASSLARPANPSTAVLGAPDTYTRATTVADGTLLDSSIASLAVTVENGRRSTGPGRPER